VEPRWQTKKGEAAGLAEVAEAVQVGEMAEGAVAATAVAAATALRQQCPGRWRLISGHGSTHGAAIVRRAIGERRGGGSP